MAWIEGSICVIVKKGINYSIFALRVLVSLLLMINGQAHGILILTAHAQKPPFSAHLDISSGARSLNFGLGLHLHSYVMHTSSEGSDETAHVRSLVRALASRRCDKYHKLVCWSIYTILIN